MTALNTGNRTAALKAISDDRGLDVLVIGGGVTGAGIALDAATRGLRVGVVDAQDWGSGTSSRSSKLVHGGLRYLPMLDFKLVSEALGERGLLIDKLAPHLVRAVPFLYPLTKWYERPYVRESACMTRWPPSAPATVPSRSTGTSPGAVCGKSFPESRRRSAAARSATTTARSTTPGW